MTKNLENLPTFIKENLKEFSRSPPCCCQQAYHLFTYKGIQVQLVFERDENEQIISESLFNNGGLK